MGYYEELIGLGATPTEIRDVTLEENSNEIRQLTELGATPDEIFSVLEEETGMPKALSMGALEYSPFAESGTLIDKPLETLKGAGERIMSGDYTATGVAKDVAGGSIHGTGGVAEMLGQGAKMIPDVASLTPSGILMNIARKGYDYFADTQTAPQTLKDTGLESAYKGIGSGLEDVGQQIQLAGWDIAEDPQSASFAVGNILEPLTAGAIKAPQLLRQALPEKFIKNVVNGVATDKQTYDLLVKESGSTANDLIQYNQKYGEAIGKPVSDFTEVDKINALMDNSEVASKFRMQAEYYSESILGKSKEVDEALREVIGKRTKGGNLYNPILQLKQFSKDAGKLYGEVKNILLDNYNVNVELNQNSVNSLIELVKGSTDTAGGNAVTNKVLAYLDNAAKSGNLSVEDLIDMKQSLNSLNLKSTKAFKAGQVGSFIDEAVRKGIGEDGFALWKDVNSRYATKKLLEKDNPIAKIFIDSDGNSVKSLSEKDIANKLLNLQYKGYGTFNSLRNAIGEEATEQVEKEIINIAMKSEGGLLKALDKIGEFEFSTVAGRSLQSELDRIKGMVPDEDIVRMLKTSFKGRTPSVGWSDNLISKMKFTLIGKAWNRILRSSPSGGDERAFLRLGEILQDRTALDNMNIKTGEIYEAAHKAYKEDLKQKIKTLQQNKAPKQEIDETKEELKEVNRFGIQPKRTPKQQVKKPVKTLSELLQPTKEDMAPMPIAGEDPSRGMLGMKYGTKATGTGGVNTAKSKEQLKGFLDSIANPKVSVDTKKVSELFDMLKADNSVMYAASESKKKAWKKAMDEVGRIRSMKSVSPKDRENMIQAVKDYFNLLDDTM